MKDYNSISKEDRYFNSNSIDVSIGVGILDISRDIQNNFIRKKSFDMTLWMIRESLSREICSYSGFNHSVKKILEESIKNGNDLCIILAQGMMAPKLYKIITKVSQYYTQNPNFFVMGHIMAKEGRYPGLHRQMLVVNLKKWKQLESPEFEEQGFFWERVKHYSNYKLSEETLSADYTPAYIEKASGEQEVYVVEDGSNWIDIACRNNIRVDNFSFEIRDCKAFLYPYDNPDRLEYVWNNLQDEKEIDKIENYTQRAWIRKLAYQEHIEKNRVYAFNTESLSSEGVRCTGPIDAIFGAAAGFKTLKLLDNNGFHDSTIVNYYDWCDASLKFHKHLIDTWNGLDFDEWLLKNDLQYNFANIYRANYTKFWEQEIEKEFGSKTDFKKLWDRYVKLQHNFFVIDLVNEPQKLIDEINKQTGTKVLWTTNIWPTMMLHWNMDIDIIEEKYLKFEKSLPNDIILYGQDYLANDIRHRIDNDTQLTHFRYSPTNKYIINLEE